MQGWLKVKWSGYVGNGDVLQQDKWIRRYFVLDGYCECNMKFHLSEVVFSVSPFLLCFRDQIQNNPEDSTAWEGRISLKGYHIAGGQRRNKPNCIAVARLGHRCALLSAVDEFTKRQWIIHLRKASQG